MPNLVLRTSVPQNIYTQQSHRTQAKTMPGLPTSSSLSHKAGGAQGAARGSFMGTALVTPKHTNRSDRAERLAPSAIAPQTAEALNHLCHIASDPSSAAVRALGPDGMNAVNTLCQASAQGASGGNDTLNTIANLAFPLILVGGLFALMRGRGPMGGAGQGGMFDFGKSRAKLAKESGNAHHVQGRGRHRLCSRGAARNCELPQAPGKVQRAGCQAAQGRTFGRQPRRRQDPVGAGHCG